LFNLLERRHTLFYVRYSNGKETLSGGLFVKASARREGRRQVTFYERLVEGTGGGVEEDMS
jgi:hypothetical protein